LVGLETHVVCRDMLTLAWQDREDFTDAVPEAGRYLKRFEPTWTSTTRSSATYGYLGEVRNFALRCLGRVQGGPDLWDSYRSLLLGEAVYTSAAKGRVEQLTYVR